MVFLVKKTAQSSLTALYIRFFHEAASVSPPRFMQKQRKENETMLYKSMKLTDTPYGDKDIYRKPYSQLSAEYPDYSWYALSLFDRENISKNHPFATSDEIDTLCVHAALRAGKTPTVVGQIIDNTKDYGVRRTETRTVKGATMTDLNAGLNNLLNGYKNGHIASITTQKTLYGVEGIAVVEFDEKYY